MNGDETVAGGVMGTAVGAGPATMASHAAACGGATQAGWWVGGLWGFLQFVISLLFWAAMMVGIMLGIRWLVAVARESRPDTALDILRERYARGEIAREEFEARRGDLASVT